MTCQRVLLIDDEANVLKALERVFRREPLDLVTTSNPAEALTLVSECETAVIVSDQRMPQMPGTHLLEKLRQIAPDAIRMTLTGYADKDAAIEAINRGAVHRFLTKPWDDQQLKQEILHAVEEYNLKSEVKRLQAVTLEQNRQLQEWNSQLEIKVDQRTSEITQLNRELRTSLMTSIAVMSRLGEIHSPTICSHSQRVAALARDLAIDLHFDASTVNATYAAALLHDIGKMGLPRELLEKNPGFFNESEKELYRGHVLEGERIIALVPAIHSAAQLVRSHHDRWDGTGYPDGLAGEAIPCGARLIAVADAYDNFIHSKANFGTISAARALEQIIQASGIWFDPAAVRALIVLLGRRNIDQDYEIEAYVKDLVPGMKLAADVRSQRGVLLVPIHSELTQPQIDRLKWYSLADPVAQPIRIRQEVLAESSDRPASARPVRKLDQAVSANILVKSSAPV